MESIRRPHAPGAPRVPDGAASGDPSAAGARRAAPLHAVELPLSVAFRDPSRPLDVPPGEATGSSAGAPLAALVYGDDPEPRGASLVVRVPLPRVGGTPLAEIWTGPAAADLRQTGAVRLAAAGPVAFATIDLPDAAAEQLEAVTAKAYRELLAATAASGHPHLLRVWAVVPAINQKEDGLERYRRFCRGRAEALEHHYGAGFTGQLSASTGVGSSPDGGRLLIYVLAGRRPGWHRENPRQLAAYRYPAAYGPRSPSFARATLCCTELGSHLLISGTAAIVGHRSLHPGSVRLQTRETLANLARLATGRAAPAGLPYRQLKIYLRRAEDRPLVEGELRSELGPDVPLLFLRADICRHELEVEIEGVA